MSGPRHQTVVGRPNAVRLTAILLLSGLLLGAPFNATANAQNAPATRTAPAHPFATYIEEAAQRFRIAETTRWTAILTIVVQVPRNADRLRANPLGIYVNAINWSRELGQ